MKKLYDYHGNKEELFEQILKQKNSINIPDNIPESLTEDYKIARTLDNYLEDYFDINNQFTSISNVDRKIDKILDKFIKEVLDGVYQEKDKFRKAMNTKKKTFKNIFEFSKSENLYLSNMYTRFISENLGHKLEEIANLSNNVYIPDRELEINIKGIDLIIYDQGLIKYTQLKTKKDTLTGSQKDRSIIELRIHPHYIIVLDYKSVKIKS
ncbi:hypothetical protein WH8501_00380 [Crocosphaera watsonii WH 8501]|uniref:Uncharacterized protein n=2 Tax=Crocosphaera watsonii TaxID=263511 RepID=Q4BZE0_CROWT|nr:hypothetical protein [Crocosphaera watsonii]EAM49270.1 hypothetical protein CwatDRAFT_2013 [Crocosphaera watsonii WH 8501]CCQ50010.1 FIG00563190: hypothetical protein [Crocosphaera watsonii WH 8502]